MPATALVPQFGMLPVQEEAELARRRLQQRGDLYQSGGWWKLRWRVDVIGTAGALKRSWSTPVIVGPCAGNPAMKAITQKEARRLAWENFLARLDQNTRTPQSITTVEQFWERKFEPEHVSSLKPSGQLHYRTYWKHVQPVLGKLQLREVTSDHVQYLVSSFQRRTWTPTLPKDEKRAKLVRPRRYSVQTALHVRNVVSGIFSYAKEKGWYSGENPAEHVRLPEMQRREKHSLVFDTARSLLAALKPPTRELAYSLIVLSCNVAELLGLMWKHVNLSDQWGSVDGSALPPWSLAIRQQWRLGQYCSVKAAGRKRIIQIPPALRSTLTGMKARPRYTGPGDPVFVSSTGRPLDQHGYLRTLKRAGAKVGMPWISWHVFRNTHATLTKIVGREVGLSDHDRMLLMGHGTLPMTDRYTGAEMDRQAAALELIAERLMGEPQGGVQ